MSRRPRGTPDALLLDEMFSPDLAERLMVRGVDCAAVAARAMLRSMDDLDVFLAAVEEHRVLVTNNVVDFESLRRQAQAEGRPLPGLIYSSDRAIPRDRQIVARLAIALEGVARDHRVADFGGVLWLQRAGDSQPFRLRANTEPNSAL